MRLVCLELQSVVMSDLTSGTPCLMWISQRVVLYCIRSRKAESIRHLLLTSAVGSRKACGATEPELNGCIPKTVEVGQKEFRNHRGEDKRELVFVSSIAEGYYRFIILR